MKIHQVLDNTHYIVCDWDEKLLSPKIHINRLKRCILNLQEIDKTGQLHVANNVRDLFCKWEELAKSKGFAKRKIEEDNCQTIASQSKAYGERGKDVSV